MLGGRPYIQIQTCNDDDHISWNYYAMLSTDGGHHFHADGGGGLGQQASGHELMVPLNESSSLGIPFQLFFLDEHTAAAPATVLSLDGDGVRAEGAFPTGRLARFTGIPYVLGHRHTAAGCVPWNTTNGFVTNGRAIQVGDTWLATVYFEPDIPAGTPLTQRLSSVLCFASKDGWEWRFKSVVASNFGRPGPPYGPSSGKRPGYPVRQPRPSERARTAPQFVVSVARAADARPCCRCRAQLRVPWRCYRTAESSASSACGRRIPPTRAAMARRTACYGGRSV
jgi:hypothetical protein